MTRVETKKEREREREAEVEEGKKELAFGF